MIHDYYCVDCGRKHRGEEISFDLAEFLGLKNVIDPTGSVSRVTLISVEKLKEFAERSGNPLQHGTPSKIRITLREFLMIMAENAGGTELKNQMLEYTRDELEDAVEDVIDTGLVNDAVRVAMKERYVSALSNKFVYNCISLKEDNSDEDEDTDRENLDNYVAQFWVKPEFFEDGNSDQIYTVTYSDEPNPVNMKEMVAPRKIRGYCPDCGKPVLENTGKYPHILVGLLGIQSAGKTSLIVSMIEEMTSNYSRYRVKFPNNILCDSRYSYMEQNRKLFRNGWAVEKTAAETNTATFNASLLLTSEGAEKKAIYTFIDIAGEMCYDKETQTVRADALEMYPLINSCQCYLLCTSINQKNYGNAASQKAQEVSEEENISENIPEEKINPQAAMIIVQEIYKKLRRSENILQPGKLLPLDIPPLCVVATKADKDSFNMTDIDEDITDKDIEDIFEQMRQIRKNPLDDQEISSELFHKSRLEEMRDIYDQLSNEDIQEAIDRCCDVIRDMKQTTYVSMMSCSALGRGAVQYEGNMNAIPPYKNEAGRKVPFSPVYLEDLWKWILQVTGLIEVEGTGYTFSAIPSYNESYVLSNDVEEDCKYRKKFHTSESEARINAVRHLFLNPSAFDRDVEDAWNEEVTFFERLRHITPETRVDALVREHDV